MIGEIYARSGLLGVGVFLVMYAGYSWFNQKTQQQMNHAAADDHRETLVTEAFVRVVERGQQDSEATRQLTHTLSTEIATLRSLIEKSVEDIRSDVTLLKDLINELIHKGDAS